MDAHHPRREPLEVRAAAQGMRCVDLPSFNVDASAIGLVPAHVCLRHQVIPIAMTDRVVPVATATGNDGTAIDDLRRASGLQVQMVLASEDAVHEAILHHYGGSHGREEPQA